MKSLTVLKSGLITALLASVLLPFSVATAATLKVVAPPMLTVSANGKNIELRTAEWNQPTKTILSWLVDGKVLASATKKVLPLPKKIGTTVQVQEKAPGKTVLSNKIRVGDVIVNAPLKINFTEGNNGSLSLQLPPTFPAKVSANIQWFLGPFEIKGAHAPTYELTTGDQGGDLSASVVFSAKGFASTKSVSNVLSIPVTPREYKPIWSDEFNSGSQLNPQVWVPQNGDGTAFGIRGWGNQERQWYVDTQSKIDSTGAFVINAAKDGAQAYRCYYGTNCEWISSKFVTKGHIGFKYGRLEARIKGPLGTGTWGAFWLLGANIDDRPWPGCGEIDIAELIGRDPNQVYGTPHGPASGDSSTAAVPNGFASDFHTYAIDWLPDQITWYLDGKAYGTLNRSSLVDPEHTWVFDHEFYLIINLAMGGNFAGALDPQLNAADMKIDYIRYSSINGIGELTQH